MGDAPPQDVDTAYGLVCGLFLGEAVGLIAQRLLWPRTAMQIFTARAAAQLDLCSRALGDGDRGSEGAGRGENAAGLVSTYAKQLTQLGQLHAQAHAEPVERALDDTRRAELLALTQDLFDASLRAGGGAPSRQGAVPPQVESALAPLRSALLRREQALSASLTASAAALRGTGPGPTSDLSAAQRAVEAQFDAIRGQAEIARALGAHDTQVLLAHLDAIGALAAGQLAIEAWLADWHRAAAAASPARH
jgi:hypothetical protein